MENKLEIGIIGFGVFGQLAAKHLKKHAKVFAFDTNGSLAKQAIEMGVVFTSLEVAASRKVVVFAVPISKMRASLEQAKKYVRPEAIVFDTCSVKEFPARLMKKMLPPKCAIIATHPLFGPQSAKKGIRGLRIVVCPVRSSKKELQKAVGFLRQLGLHVLVCSPEEHDRQLAHTQALMHFVLFAWKQDAANARREFATVSYLKLLEAARLIENDSAQLIFDMQKHNRFAGLERKKLLRRLAALDKRFSK